MKVLVTGATGFVGGAVMKRLAEAGHEAFAAVRATCSTLPHHRQIVTGPIETAEWKTVLIGFDAVIHLAARVHRMRDASPDPLEDFRRINRDATLRLAEAALMQDVNHFVFLSSVKAAVDATGIEGVDDHVQAAPQSPYGISKREAEQGLLILTRNTEMQPVILRPPLVYGPGAKGNLPPLFRLARSGVPLPFAAIHNRRSLIGLGNLTGAILHALEVSEDPLPVYFVDDVQVSTPELIRLVAGAMGRRAKLLPFPVGGMRRGAAIFGKGAAVDRLTESLAINSARFRATGWNPAIAPQQELELLARSLYP